ncbi:Flavonol reductase/cinnamoyl-CoA reductase [Handroanthus impetiginosus]|uniref:Dihydroflavonol 4-reductase n=1 Tax=Handroanthus impetiginosus TaxID=429701 RepID=A0A2G9HE12_9LAMI|nr:Flavonol reductase/cinnamoyl-CoA reductase [Handroanthus impetiginosus]
MGMETIAPLPPKVCVTGASGFIGSWLVRKLLERGYIVHATVRDPGNMKKVKHLVELPKADTNLTLWKADMNLEGSYDEAIQGCEGVFHMATPMEFESKDPENEVIKPTVEGMMSIIRSCAKANTVKKLIFTSSAGSLNVEEEQKPVYDETNWSDLDFIYSKKMTGWVYFASKLLAEKAAMEAAKENNINFISIIPTLVVGPFITPTLPPSLITALSPITGNEAHYSIIKQGQYVHVDDLCEAHIFLFEAPTAQGRYICSSNDATIYDLANLIREKWPEYHVPEEFDGIEKDIPVVSFSPKKLTGMGFSFKYSMEDMFRGAIETCRQKGLLSYSSQIHDHGEEKDTLLNSHENKEELPTSKEKHSDKQEKEQLPTIKKHSAKEQEKGLLSDTAADHIDGGI